MQIRIAEMKGEDVYIQESNAPGKDKNRPLATF